MGGTGNAAPVADGGAVRYLVVIPALGFHETITSRSGSDRADNRREPGGNRGTNRVCCCPEEEECLAEVA